MSHLLYFGCSWSVVDYVSVVELQNYLLKVFCVLTVVVMIVRFTLNLRRLDGVNLRFSERVYDLEYGRDSELSVRLLVCCVV
jgi:hypothetical protein